MYSHESAFRELFKGQVHKGKSTRSNDLQCVVCVQRGLGEVNYVCELCPYRWPTEWIEDANCPLCPTKGDPPPHFGKRLYELYHQAVWHFMELPIEDDIIRMTAFENYAAKRLYLVHNLPAELSEGIARYIFMGRFAVMEAQVPADAEIRAYSHGEASMIACELQYFTAYQNACKELVDKLPCPFEKTAGQASTFEIMTNALITGRHQQQQMSGTYDVFIEDRMKVASHRSNEVQMVPRPILHEIITYLVRRKYSNDRAIADMGEKGHLIFGDVDLQARILECRLRRHFLCHKLRQLKGTMQQSELLRVILGAGL